MPIAEKAPTEQKTAPTNAHKVEGLLKLMYNEPTVLGIVQVKDLDGQGVSYDCTAKKPDGTTQNFQRTASGTTLADTLRVVEPASEQDKYVVSSCKLGAQTDTAMVRDSAFIPKRIVQPPTITNNHKPQLEAKLLYNDSTVSRIVDFKDLDNQSGQLNCTLQRPSGTYNMQRTGASIADTLRFTESRTTTDKNLTLHCIGIAQNDTVKASSSLLIEKVTPPPPPPTTNYSGILNLNNAGANGKSYAQNLSDLTEAMFKADNNLVVSRTINGKTMVLVPWYKTSSSSNISDLHSSPYISSASRDRFLMVTDELSEACIIAAAGSNNERMRGFRNTIEALRGTNGLPGWIAEVNGSNMTLRDPGSASDATARLGLCMYAAAKNPDLDATDRSAYRALADDLLRKHLQFEYSYVPSGVTSPVTGRRMSHIAAGGVGTASAGLTNMEMWQGYYGDIALFLLAGYASTGDNAVKERMVDVIDQSLIAAQYNPQQPQQPRLGHFKMKWQNNNTLAPREPSPGDWYWSNGNPSWDAADAPRFLHIFRILEQAKQVGENTSSGVYSHLRNLGESLINNGTQTATSSCMQYYNDGRVIQGNCGSNPYANGIGGQMMLGVRPSWVKSKIDSALQGIDWSKGAAWGMQVPGIYQSARLPKLLIAAGGLDAAAYSR